MTFVDNGDGTATLAGIPVAGTAGAYALTITATNTAESATQYFTLTVSGAPTFTSAATATFTAGLPGTFHGHRRGNSDAGDHASPARCPRA